MDIFKHHPPFPSPDFFIMIMIESVDALVTISSQDLWAEICSSLPHPDQKEESSNAFADSFADSYVHVQSQDEVMNASFQANPKPWAPLKDSEIYLASLGLYIRCTWLFGICCSQYLTFVKTYKIIIIKQ